MILFEAFLSVLLLCKSIFSYLLKIDVLFDYIIFYNRVCDFNMKLVTSYTTHTFHHFSLDFLLVSINNQTNQCHELFRVRDRLYS